MAQGRNHKWQLWTIHSEQADYFHMDTPNHILHHTLVMVEDE